MVLCKMYNDERALVSFKQIDKSNYAINYNGEVINIKNKIKIKPYYDRSYIKYTLNKKKYYAHILVAKLFIRNKNKIKNIVNHIDGNKSNSHVTNLEWVTQSENILHAYKTGLIKKKNKNKCVEINLFQY